MDLRDFSATIENDRFCCCECSRSKTVSVVCKYLLFYTENNFKTSAQPCAVSIRSDRYSFPVCRTAQTTRNQIDSGSSRKADNGSGRWKHRPTRSPAESAKRFDDFASSFSRRPPFSAAIRNFTYRTCDIRRARCNIGPREKETRKPINK